MNIPGSRLGSYNPPRDGDRVLHTPADWNRISGTPSGDGGPCTPLGMGSHTPPGDTDGASLPHVSP